MNKIKEQVNDFQKVDILSKSKELFFQCKGYPKSDDLATHCGYSKRTIYKYYSSLQQIEQEAIQDAYQHLGKQLAKKQVTTMQQFADAVFEYAQDYQENIYFCSLRKHNAQNEDDFFHFSAVLKPLVDIITKSAPEIQRKVHRAMLLWNMLLYVMSNQFELEDWVTCAVQSCK